MKIEVKSIEYKISDLADNLVLYTTELNDEIACSFFSAALGKVALARNANREQLNQLIKEMNPNNLIEEGLIRVQIIGGDESEKSQKYLEHLIAMLKTIDNHDNIINVVSLDTGTRFHSNSFELDCYHGGIRAI
ncbi:hypothetical protein [Rickettsia endosymbiont of Halotydeus destructor]|uniref:hypothetical protein n=1 Tax=Rickettsia endosymbiont of Halotydeus destructor TaxID=2996754 RepID=UPI003BAEF9D5